MKPIKHFILLFIISISSCKKEIKSPNATPEIKTYGLFNFRLTGYKSNLQNHYINFTDEYGNIQGFGPILVVDSCAIYVNGELKYNETYGYHRKFNAGDLITFYIKGKLDSLNTDRNFAIYQDKNSPYIIEYYKPDSLGVIKGSYKISSTLN